MQEKFEKNLEKVKRIIEDLDSFKFGNIEAKHRFNAGNKLLDECIGIINKKEFKLDEISLRSGELLLKK